MDPLIGLLASVLVTWLFCVLSLRFTAHWDNINKRYCKVIFSVSCSLPHSWTI